MLAAMGAVQGDHKELVAQRDDRETWWTEEKSKREKQRQDAIKTTTSDLDAYQKQIAPKLAELGKQREQTIAAAEASLKKYQEALAVKSAEFLKKQGNVEWHVLEPATLAATGNVKLEKQDDGSIQATGKANLKTQWNGGGAISAVNSSPTLSVFNTHF